MSAEDIPNQDKAIEKIHREENLDDSDNNYDMDRSLSDSDLSKEEEENSPPP
ncbi:hypothetical protein BH18THE1_BH18THE1_22090 [soil metagenome]